jgi:pimeloyl-ACP methyl ester carboxylesterase
VRESALPVVGLAAVLVGTSACGDSVAAAAANGLLHPQRHAMTRSAPEHCEETTFAGADVTLAAWRCRTTGARRATVIYLHGIADNRASGTGAIDWLRARGFDVVAYDSRGHGQSGGDTCTYGYYEKLDLRSFVDAIDSGGVVLVGTSLGAAVALQEAADDPRVIAIVAAETFSDLRTIATERAPRILTRGLIERAFVAAERLGKFRVDEVSPVVSAPRIAAPVLLVHGAHDRDTRPEHSRRVYDALRGNKRLIIVPGAGHNQSLSGEAWRDIEAWIDSVLPRRTAT